MVAGAPKAGVLVAAAPNAGAAVVAAPKGDAAALVKVPKEGRLCCEVVAGVPLNPNCPVVAAVVGAKVDPNGEGALDAAPKAAPKALDAVVVVGAAPKPPKPEID